VKLGKNANDTCAMLSEAYGTEAMKIQVILNGINGSRRAYMSKSQMMTMLITFFDIKGTVHFEFTPQGQIVNQVYYVEILKWLQEAAHKRSLNFSPVIGFSTMTLL
jgi:hypothetical protein